MRLHLVAVAVAVGLAGCGVSQEMYAAKNTELIKAQTAYQDETGKTAALEEKVAQLQKKLAATEQQLAQASTEHQEAQAKASALEARSAQYERLAKSLKVQIQSGQVELTELKGRMMVKLKDKILFASGSATLGKDGQDALDAVAEVFKEMTEKNVVVVGHTDDVAVKKGGPWLDNWDLSTARAAAVVRHLEMRGVAPQRLAAGGYSQYRPVVSNDSPVNRSLNRRIEIILTAADYVAPVVEIKQNF